ncbi:MAG: 4Fe-4S binding protein, partial [Anaerolineae bacterium]|nr:4Fe-4S binding protein [Anaerolineae bacterium]
IVVALVASWLGFTVLFVLMLTTGKTYRYRSILFILTAIALPLDFIPYMVETYGSMMLTDDVMYSGGASFCPLTMPMVLIPALLKGVVIFPGEILPGVAKGAFSVMFILWVGASLAVGRGWCSWGCFYGGWDELFSRIRKKPLITHKQIDRRWRYLPFAVLLAIVLLSAITFSPIYCEWLCPFKAVTEFQAPSSTLAVIQITIFVLLFIGLVVVLPLLTKRRIQCGLFCPFGAMQSFLNKINVFEVRIDPEKCSQCKKCIRECPTFSLDESSLESGKPLMTCTKCAQCVDTCPQGAITYHIKGTPLKANPTVAKVLFLYPAYILLMFLGAGSVAAALYRILMLVTTGSMLH